MKADVQLTKRAGLRWESG